MLEINSHSFLGAITQANAIIRTANSVKSPEIPAGLEDKAMILQNLVSLIREFEAIGARSALVAAQRLQERLHSIAQINYLDIKRSMEEIESRFADHLLDVKFYIMPQNELALMQPVDDLLSTPSNPVVGFGSAFPNAAFEIEESCKCCALNRHTAAVFHSMRALECGLKAMCSLIGAPEVTKPADKNWGKMLSGIKQTIDEKWPANQRLPDTIGSKMESLYVLLEAVRSPWRNSTMHVEVIYLQHEALHIMRCVGMFLLELAKHCDEKGRNIEESPGMAEVKEANPPSPEEVFE